MGALLLKLIGAQFRLFPVLLLISVWKLLGQNRENDNQVLYIYNIGKLCMQVLGSALLRFVQGDSVFIWHQKFSFWQQRPGHFQALRMVFQSITVHKIPLLLQIDSNRNDFLFKVQLHQIVFLCLLLFPVLSSTIVVTIVNVLM